MQTRGRKTVKNRKVRRHRRAGAWWHGSGVQGHRSTSQPPGCDQDDDGGFSDNPDLLKRFYREAQSTGNLQHPNIVTVYDLGDLEGNPYLVMEYLEGETLDAIINSRNPLTLLAKINYICDVCHGLAYAHHHGIVHRDIKPGNVMVLKNGGVKIVDFGIAPYR